MGANNNHAIATSPSWFNALGIESLRFPEQVGVFEVFSDPGMNRNELCLRRHVLQGIEQRSTDVSTAIGLRNIDLPHVRFGKAEVKQ